MGEWQKIETAPKDGTRVDLWVRHPDRKSGGFREIGAFYQAEEWRSALGFGITSMRQSDGSWAIYPTHWMPIPPPPEEQ